jgi:hypothetical protein
LLFRGTKNACLCQVSGIIGRGSLGAPGKLNKAQAPGIKVCNFAHAINISAKQNLIRFTPLWPVASAGGLTFQVTTTSVTESRVTSVKTGLAEQSGMALKLRGSRCTYIGYRAVNGQTSNTTRLPITRRRENDQRMGIETSAFSEHVLTSPQLTAIRINSILFAVYLSYSNINRIPS